MKLGLMLGYSGAQMHVPVELVQRVEDLGFDAVWTAEAYGSDATSPLVYLAAVTKRIRERYREWEKSGATGLLISSQQPDGIELMAELTGSRDRVDSA